jgi:DNA polymerase III subunit delta
MPLLKYDEIVKQIENGAFAPVYFLFGDEPFFIDRIMDRLENQVLPEADRAFNQITLYGRDVDFKAILDEANQYPMMADKRLVLVKEAQEFKDLDKLTTYFSQPVPTTVLAFAYKYKKPDGRTTFYKALSKSGVLMKSDPVYDNHLPGWITQYLAAAKLKVEPGASMLLSEYVGANLSKMSNELDKLALNMQPGTTVTSADIEKYIGISKDYNVFELQKALSFKDAKKIASMAEYFRNNAKENPAVLMIGALYRYFTKVMIASSYPKWNDKQLLAELKLGSPFFLKEYKSAAKHYNREKVERAFHYLLEADKKNKGIDHATIPEGEIIRELIFKVAHL